MRYIRPGHVTWRDQAAAAPELWRPLITIIMIIMIIIIMVISLVISIMIIPSILI